VQIDGKTIFPYLLKQHDGSVIPGYDVRPLVEIRSEWLRSAQVSATKEAKHGKAAIKANMLNEHKRKKLHDENEFSPRENDTDTSKDIEVEGPPVCGVELGEMLTLNGIPTREGYGSVSVLAYTLAAIAHFDHGDDGSDYYSPPTTKPGVKKKRA
jgi:hypothetical protein